MEREAPTSGFAIGCPVNQAALLARSALSHWRLSHSNIPGGAGPAAFVLALGVRAWGRGLSAAGRVVQLTLLGPSGQNLNLIPVLNRLSRNYR